MFVCVLFFVDQVIFLCVFFVQVEIAITRFETVNGCLGASAPWVWAPYRLLSERHAALFTDKHPFVLFRLHSFFPSALQYQYCDTRSI